MEPITKCRVCASPNLTHLFSLGEQYVSDFVPEDKVKSGIKVPISLCLCSQCTLVQQEYTAPSDFMYTRHYWYRSGTTETMRRALAEVVDAAMDQVKLKPGDVVLDIGSNDGTLLRQYPKELGLTTVGIEPAINMKEEGSRGVEVFIGDFWSAKAYEKYFVLDRVADKAKIVTAIGMFYDLEDPNAFIADIAKVLHPEGVFIAQLMCLKQMLGMKDVGNLAHEHLEFYSLRSLIYLFNMHKLVLYDIQENKVNGGSYRLFIRHSGQHEIGSQEGYSRIKEALRVEEQWKLASPISYKDWWNQVRANNSSLTAFLQQAKLDGKKVWVYGASTKGNVLLQFCGAGPDLIEGAADKSKEKWGRYTVGTGIKIASDFEMREHKPDYLLLLPYAFLDEFIERETAFLARGGKFIVPLPIPMLVGVEHWDDGSGTPLLEVTKL